MSNEIKDGTRFFNHVAVIKHDVCAVYPYKIPSKN